MLLELKKEVFKAQKSGDTLRVSVLRFLLSALQNKEIEMRSSGGELTQEDIYKTVKKQIKQLNQTIENYKQAGREDETAKAKSEIAILEEYLPEELK